MNIEILFFIVFCMLVGYAIWKPLEVKSKKNAQKTAARDTQNYQIIFLFHDAGVSPASSSGPSSTNHEEV